MMESSHFEFDHLDLHGVRSLGQAYYLHRMVKVVQEQLQQRENKPLRILEVGCGDGTFASLLVHFLKNMNASAVDYIAIDASESAISEARNRGVNAHVCDFTAFKSEEPFDVVYFSKSLHHVFPLDKAAQVSFSLLRVGGFLVADEFDSDLADEPTVRWIFQSSDILTAAGFLQHKSGGDHSQSHTSEQPEPQSHSHSHSHAHDHAHHQHVHDHSPAQKKTQAK